LADLASRSLLEVVDYSGQRGCNALLAGCNALLAASGSVVNSSRATYDVQLAAPVDRSGALRHGVSLVGGQRQCKPASLIIA